jgi:acetylornithine deacetylase/succinyl-diaminopimelate desuccinylase-like protein
MDRRELSPMTGWPKGGTIERHEIAADTNVVPLADVAPADIGDAPGARDSAARNSCDIHQDEGTERVWRWAVTVEGTCTRSSTTPTDRRRDALLSATRFVEAANRIVRSHPTRVTGSIAHASRQPRALNDSEGRFVLCLELRDADPATVGRIYERIAAEAWTIGRLSQTKLALTPHESNPSVLYDINPQSVAAQPPAFGHAGQRSSPSASDESDLEQELRTG